MRQFTRSIVFPPGKDHRISPLLQNIILKALDKDPERRYQSARELKVDLQRAGAGRTVNQKCTASPRD
jgi:serine/threonine protein kinase